MRIHKHITIAVVAALLTNGFLCTDLSLSPVEIQPGERFEVRLKEGKNVVLAPENVVLEFSKVESDSRCPEDVRCIIAGEAEVTLRVEKGGRSIVSILQIPGLVITPYRGAVVEEFGYRISLLQLDPYPRLDERENPRVFIAHLEIEKLP